MLPGWPRWVNRDRRCLQKPDVAKLAAMGESRSQMLIETGCYQVGSDGCWPNHMLLETGCYQDGSDGCSTVADVFRNPMFAHGSSVRRMCLGSRRKPKSAEKCTKLHGRERAAVQLQAKHRETRARRLNTGVVRGSRQRCPLNSTDTARPSAASTQELCW